MLERLRDRRIGYPASVLLVLATIGILKVFRGLADSTVALMLLLAVFLSAWLWESGPGAVAAVAATLGFNFFFIPPQYTLTVEDPRNVAALVVFLLSGLLIGRLSALARSRLRQLEMERADLAAMIQLSRAFLSDTNRESLLGAAAERLRGSLNAEEVQVILAAEEGGLEMASSTGQWPIRLDLAELTLRRGKTEMVRSESGTAEIYVPIPIGLKRAGVLIARGMKSRERLAEGCAVLLGLALERERFLRMAREAEETKASDEMKSTLLAALAHDLKTPVAAALGAIENMAAETRPSEGLRLALAELRSLTRRIGELLEVVRLDAGTARPRRRAVTCSEIVEAAIARFGNALAEHSLSVELPPPEIWVEVDPGQLTEALGHGLENAARYSPAGTRIQVSAAADRDSVFIRISDQGCGIPPSDRERVLDRFVRLPSASKIPGTGLGLSIARGLVEMNGGKVRLTENPGGGTVFEVEIPPAPL